MNDLISRKALIKELQEISTLEAISDHTGDMMFWVDKKAVYKVIEKLPTIQPQRNDRLIDGLRKWQAKTLKSAKYEDAVEDWVLDEVIDFINQQPTSDGWIPVSYHETTEEEKEVYGNECPYILDCPMPDVDTEILVCTKKGNVFVDTACYDWGWYLDGGFDFVEDIVAWQPLPQPYKESE